jgi:nucleoside 2-deoxyribosyltransferase
MIMKIYFAGSIRGGYDDFYPQIITLLQKYGEVLTEHIGDKSLSRIGETKLTDEEIYKRDMQWLNAADVIVAEVSTPSLGVGYEIGKAENRKPILCIYREQNNARLSAMISGNPNFVIKKYSDLNQVEEILEKFFNNYASKEAVDN